VAPARWKHPPAKPAVAASCRGGNRQANSALYRIALSRLRWDARTRDYLARRITEGKTHREAIRCLKRYIAREIYRIITSPPETQLSAA
jgi:transposase